MVAERSFRHTEDERKRKRIEKSKLTLDQYRERIRNKGDRDTLIIETQEELDEQLFAPIRRVKSVIVPVKPKFVSIGTQTTPQTCTVGTQVTAKKEPALIVRIPASPPPCERCKNRSTSRNKRRRETIKNLRAQVKEPKATDKDQK